MDKTIISERYGKIIYVPIVQIDMIHGEFKDIRNAVEFWSELKQILHCFYNVTQEEKRFEHTVQQVFTCYIPEKKANKNWYKENKKSDYEYFVDLRAGKDGYIKQLPIAQKIYKTIEKLFDKYKDCKNLIFY